MTDQRERWNSIISEPRPNANVDAFLAELIEVFRKHNMSISHEDHHGGFIIESFSDANVNWLLDASDGVAWEPES